MLFPLLPRAAGSVPRRAMFLVPEVWSALNSPQGSAEWEQRVAGLQADLEIFVEGQAIDPKYMFLLHPARDAVWEIRSVRPSPSIRVLGRFAGRDVFVATGMALRETLGGWQSREWNAMKRAAIARWTHLFHTYRPLGGTDIRLLVTGALDGRYFR